MSSRTRSTNSNKHPGNPDKKRERRTKAQMEEFRVQEAKKKEQEELDTKAKADRIANVERKLAEEVDITPRPTIKQRLRRTHAFQEPEVPLGNNPKDVFSDNSSLTNDDEFQPEPTSSSATERAASDKTDDESETELPPKKKAKTAKEPVQVQVSNNAGSGKSKGGKKNSEVSIAAISSLMRKNCLMVTTCLMEIGLGKAPAGSKPAASLASKSDKSAMLTLDQTTSLYGSLMDTSDKKSKLSGLNNSWATGNSAPAGRPRSDTFGIPTMPVATGVLGPSRRSTSTSVLSNCVAITSTGPDVAIAKLSDSDSEDSEHGIPDEDETQGPERDAAAASPLKGKRRITSSTLVKVEDTPILLYQKALQKKKFRNEDLPRGCQDQNRWRKRFIPTFLWYTAYQMDPWNLEEDAAVDAIPYQITTHDAVHIITLQRVSDSWRNTIGSAANTGLINFFESSEGFDTDWSRENFASDQLKNSKFLYSDTQGHKFKGLFRGSLFLQTLAAHYTAISGAIKVESMDASAPERMPFAAFGISAAAVERALILVATGTLTINMTKSKAMALPGFVSDNSGRQTAFNDGSRGGPTCGYLISAKNLKSKSFNEVIKRAKDLSKLARQTSTKVPIATDKFLATNDHRATLVDESASEDSEEDNSDDNFLLMQDV
ncbi:hypothetical protein V8E52_011587 [Russula decolorans]